MKIHADIRSQVSRFRGVLLIFCAIAYYVGMPTAASAWELPPGKGRDILKKSCTQCHEAELVEQQPRTRADWTKLVLSMRDLGADINDADLRDVTLYLSEHYSPGQCCKSGNQANHTNGPQETREPEQKPRTHALPTVPWQKKSPAMAQGLYRENCAVCHDLDRSDSPKLGPTLHHLFHPGRTFKNGGQPSRASVISRIKFGGVTMPAFAMKLSESQIDVLVDFLASK